jgi:hypothetical protein
MPYKYNVFTRALDYYKSLDAVVDGRKGVQAIPEGADSISVTFESTFPNTNYLVIVTLENVIDSPASIYSYNITAKHIKGFTVSFSGEIDSGNYKLNWIAQEY